jgi:hypothetical protein
VQKQLVTASLQVGRHRAAHDAEADKSYFSHNFLF